MRAVYTAMFESFDAVGLATAAAKTTVMADRAKYEPFLAGAEKYAHDHKLIVGGETATRMLLGEPPGPDDYTYELYSTHALRDSRALADMFYEMAPQGLGHYANVTTVTPNEVFAIFVDLRLLVRVTALSIHRGARAVDVIVPSVRPASFARDADGEPLKLMCMGPEIRLIDTYSALGDPSRVGEWPGLLRVESGLRALFVDEVGGKIREATGGGDEGPPTPVLIAELLRSYVPREGHVLVGSYAVAALSGDAPSGRLQLVSSNTYKDEEKLVGRIASRMGFSIQSTQNEPKVPTDTRLRRMTMYIVRGGGRREPFLDVYNAAEYQLVAYASGAKVGGKAKRAKRDTKPKRAKYHIDESTHVGSPYTILRFLLVDAWTIQLLFRMNAIGADYTRQILKGIVSDFDRTVAVLVRAQATGDFEAVFPLGTGGYIGRYWDLSIQQKREQFAAPARGGRRAFFPPYFPAAKRERKDSA